LNLVRYLGETGLVVGLVAFGAGINGAVLSMAIAAFISSIMALTLIVTHIGIKWPDFRYLKSYLKFGLPIVPLLLFAWTTELSDRYVIGHFLGVAYVGIYSASYTLCGVMGWLHRPVVQILQPTVSKSHDEGKTAEVQSYLGYSLKYVAMIAIPAAVGLSLLGRQLLLIFTTEEFASNGYLVICLVAPSQVLVMIYAVTGWQMLMLAKKTSILAATWGVAAVVNLSLNLVLVPHFGILAAAGTTLLSYALGTGITLWFAFRDLSFPVNWISILRSLTASAVMAGVILLMDPAKTWEVAFTIVLGAAVYILALLLLRGLTRDEIRFFSRLFKRNPPAIKNIHPG
jgi:O-antigen/teichoic acid export membrane protein